MCSLRRERCYNRPENTKNRLPSRRPVFYVRENSENGLTGHRLNVVLLGVAGEHQGQGAVTGDVAGSAEAVLEGRLAGF